MILPQDASLLSAWGLGQAAIERFSERQISESCRSGEWEEALPSLIAQMAQEATVALAARRRRRERDLHPSAYRRYWVACGTGDRAGDRLCAGREACGTVCSALSGDLRLPSCFRTACIEVEAVLRV